MSSMSGYINYISFEAGSNKGTTSAGRVFNDPFRLGDVDVNYTSSTVKDEYVGLDGTTDFTLAWKPIVTGTITVTTADGSYIDDGNGNIVEVPQGGKYTRAVQNIQPVDGADYQLEGAEEKVITVIYDGDGNKTTGTTVGTIDYSTGTITMNDGISGDVTINYAYNNIIIPQNDLPILNARIKSMPLLAKARRIAIYYDQMASFQSKTDYGMDLGASLSDKAVG